MVRVPAEGPLPVELEEWRAKLSRGWRDESKDADAGDKSKATASASTAKDTDVDKGDKTEATESSNLGKLVEVKVDDQGQSVLVPVLIPKKPAV